MNEASMQVHLVPRPKNMVILGEPVGFDRREIAFMGNTPEATAISRTTIDDIRHLLGNVAIDCQVARLHARTNHHVLLLVVREHVDAFSDPARIPLPEKVPWLTGAGEGDERVAQLDQNEESYYLSCRLVDGMPVILVMAARPHGLFNGTRTLIQLLVNMQAAATGEIPALEIHDSPLVGPVAGGRVGLRAHHYSANRQFARFEMIIQFIRELSVFKYNAIVFELGNKFPSKAFSSINYHDPLTGDELNEILRCCKEHFIEAIPLVNVFGHMWNFLFHPEFHHLSCKQPVKKFNAPKDPIYPAPSPVDGWRDETFCATNPECLDVAKKYIDEWLEYFKDSRFIHVGMDETWAIGSCDRCKAWINDWLENHGEKDWRVGTGALFWDYAGKIFEHCLSRGRRPIIWDDYAIHYPEHLCAIDKRVIFNNWRYDITDTCYRRGVSFSPPDTLEFYRPWLETDKPYPEYSKPLGHMDFFEDKGFCTLGAPSSNSSLSHVYIDVTEQAIRIPNCFVHGKIVAGKWEKMDGRVEMEGNSKEGEGERKREGERDLEGRGMGEGEREAEGEKKGGYAMGSLVTQWTGCGAPREVQWPALAAMVAPLWNPATSLDDLFEDLPCLLLGIPDEPGLVPTLMEATGEATLGNYSPLVDAGERFLALLDKHAGRPRNQVQQRYHAFMKLGMESYLLKLGILKDAKELDVNLVDWSEGVAPLHVDYLVDLEEELVEKRKELDRLERVSMNLHTGTIRASEWGWTAFYRFSWPRMLLDEALDRARSILDAVESSCRDIVLSGRENLRYPYRRGEMPGNDDE